MDTTPPLSPGRPNRRLRRRLKQARRWFVAIAARTLVAVMAPLPFGLTRWLFPRLTGIVAPMLLQRQILAGLDLAYGSELTARQRRQIARTICRNLGLLAAEILALVRGKLPADYIDAGPALDELDRKLDPHRGFIALSAHLGNWESLGWTMRQRWPERAGGVIARRNSNRHLNRMLEDFRGRLGMATIYQHESPRRIIRLLKEGKIVATVPDQDLVRLAGIFVPFFGRPAYTPTGPAFLAWAANVPIVGGFARRTRQGLVLECSEPIFPDPTAPRDQEIERLTRAWSEVVEAQIRKQPSDWMWFHPRWRTTPDRLAARRARKQGRATDADDARGGIHE